MKSDILIRLVPVWLWVSAGGLAMGADGPVRQAEAESPEFSVRPALRFVSPDSARVSWESSVDGAGAVAFGTTRKLGTVARSGATGREHEVVLTGLEPGTAYYYKIGIETEGGRRRMSSMFEFNTTVNFTVPAMAEAEPLSEPVLTQAARILEQSGQRKGYAVCFGGGDDGKLAEALARQSELIVFVLETDPDTVARTRERLYRRKVHGSRVTVIAVPSWDPLPLTPCLANLVVVAGREPPVAESAIVSLLVPGSGMACLAGEGGSWRMLTRPPLTAIGEWTHQYGDVENSASNGESLGGARSTGELKVQWVGRPGADFGIDRNPRMPAPLSARGRLFHQGMDRFVVLDSSNGAVLWGMEIPDLRRVNIPHDCSNWCVDEDSLFVAIKERLWIFDAATGERKRSLPVLPESPPGHEWGYVARVGDKLIGSRVRERAHYADFWGKQAWYDAKGGEGTGKVCSENLFAYTLDSRRQAWLYQNGLILNSTIAIGDGKIYFVECRNPEVIAATDRKVVSDKLWLDQYLVGIDLATGSKVLDQPIDTENGIASFYLQYTPRGILITASNTQYHLYLFDPMNGAQKWQRSAPWPDADHSGHMLHPVVTGDAIYVQPNGFALATGEIVTTRVGARRGCHTYVGAGGSLIYRGPGGQLAMWDRTSESVSGWERLRPSCWLSVIPAGGMLLVPEGGGGCSCGGWMETSLVFAPLAVLGYPPAKKEGGRPQ